MATLVAKTRIKFGSKATTSPRDGRVETLTAGTSVMPGEEFEVSDAKLAKQLLEDGSAVTTADAKAKERDGMSAEAKLREAVAEANKAGLNASVSIGQPSSSAAIEAAAHVEAQEQETAAVEAATKDQPKRARAAKS